MAKKSAPRKTTARGRKATGRKKGSRSGVFRANLKYIGAAIDQTVADLENIEALVKNKDSVKTKIAALERIKSLTRKECPNNWYAPFA